MNKASIKRTEVKAFVQFYIENAGSIAREVGYVALPADLKKQELIRFANFIQ